MKKHLRKRYDIPCLISAILGPSVASNKQSHEKAQRRENLHPEI